MRIAIVSDIHGNRTAFEAVLADLRDVSPDVVFHGGDLADAGASPTEIVDRIRDLGWRGVAGNGEEALTAPETLEKFAAQSAAPASLWTAVRELMNASRELLGEQRLEWLRALPRVHLAETIGLVHASPGDAWRSPGVEASDAELSAVYGPLGREIVVYGHIHRGFVRRVMAPPQTETMIVNTGSVSFPYDGDHRAAYLVLDDGKPTLRRVEYDVEKEAAALSRCGLPHAEWLAKTLRSASPQMP